MHIVTLLFIAIGLSMDAVAVSLSGGITLRHSLKIKHALYLGMWFGGFQMLMPILGWLVGNAIAELISSIDHWIAFGLLAAIGIKMIIESRKMLHDKKPIVNFKFSTMLLLAIATSIDAFAVGLSISLIQYSIVLSIIIIGATTFLLSFLAALTGKKAGRYFGGEAELAGGLILITIGIKILLTHLL
ncbi:MAG: hypothetical protein A2Y62_16200 [Candidatus Fischerbacteria bacterium RBG_13_37_8]|uniref:Putative manganese efflux pump MntP n=1 Tax=Candidatus Fischerbacteria bacterium RBG_13_37_8 TaxID=1817863 RepID=A0A1F5VDW5_9BACT|nr:MAG: hypothetical protein A2Y62_16200 [Candidatus Fischerbacteria bacterium RBG_13_37_8]